MSTSDKLVELRDGLITEADALVATGTTESFTAAETKLEEVRALDARIKTATEVEARAAAIKESQASAKVSPVGGATIISEVRTYNANPQSASWARDLAASQGVYNMSGAEEARNRLQRHAKEVEVEARAGSTTATAGGEFSPPDYLLQSYAEYARAVSVASNLLTNMALPEPATSSIKIPKITTGTLTALQLGNNASATTRDIVTSYVTSNVETAAGYNDISIQLLEQSPINMDAIIFGDLAKDLALAINTQVTSNNNGTSNTLLGLTYQGINNGTSVTWTQTTPDSTGLVPALGKALSGVANNRYQDAEAIIMSASEWYSVASFLDTTNRPLFATSGFAFNPLVSGNNLANSSGLVGTYGGVPVYVDATMPKTISTNQSPILVGKFSDTYLFKGVQKAGVFPDIGSSTLTVRFRLYQYVALAHRFNKSIAAISGTGTVPTSGF